MHHTTCCYCHTVIRHKPSATRKYCSKICNDSAKRVTKPCETCGKVVTKPQSQAVSRRFFCSVACANVHGRQMSTCAWLNCAEQVLTRRRLKNRGVVLYQTTFGKSRGREMAYPLCARHRALLDKHHIFCRGLTRIWQNPTRDYGTRAISSRGTRLILFDRAGEKCEQCATMLAFEEAKTWSLDHVVPVFKGGLTTMANLQVLCKACHDTKSATEKSEAACIRWAGGKTPGNRWFTHPQKDALIAQLRQEVAGLRAQIAERAGADGHVSV